MISLPRTIGLPAQLSVISSGDTKSVFEIKGLYPGFGHTMGNALRRIILSSLSGVSVISVKITGVDHEFSTMEGVTEDVLRILLNIQQIRARIVSGPTATAMINITGPGVITAASLQHDANLEIVNPDLHIAEINKKGTVFQAEITFATGIGFVPKTVFHKDRTSIGTLLVDAVFTPVRRVSYDVENMRVGERTDYNKIIMSIETDGTITPRQALDNGLKTLLVQTQSLLSLSDSDAESMFNDASAHDVDFSESAPNSDSDINDTDMLKTRIETLSLSSRTSNALVEANIRTIGGLVRKTEKNLLDLDGIGPKGVDEVKSVLDHMGLSLKD